MNTEPPRQNLSGASESAAPRTESADPVNVPPAPPGEEPGRVKPSGSDALWLLITLLNIALLLWLVPESWLESKRLSLFIKIVPVVLGLFAAGYLWFRLRLPVFLKHTSYKIFQTALLAILLTLNISQLPIFPIYPQLEPPGARIVVDGAPDMVKDGRLFMTVSDHTVKVSPADADARNQVEATYRVSYRDVFFGLFRKYSPRWSPLRRVAIGTLGPNFVIEIRKTDGEFDADFHRAPPPTALEGTSLKGHPGENNLLVYHGSKNAGGGGGYIELPPGNYEFTPRQPECARNDKQTLSVEAGQTDEPTLLFNPCAGN